ncbi:MAG: SDR family oxidoreductase [Sphingobium sp.]|uniref:SDR family oxidoreductase n=1 Tax=Sphingobium sp. TaxID=1912891 RepID=UPI0029A190AF|nr:SDR family oxidoreductase [Sphingobium sp.]MDX3909574.1 SDR family oxidoreductase [Sphingobium sp.]
MTELKGEVALVTGGASGIGLALATALAKRGMRVAITDVNEAALQSSAETLRGTGADILSLVLDVQDADSWKRALNEAEAQWGPIFLLCNNAGVGLGAAPSEEVGLAEWNWLLGINLGGVFLGVRTVAAGMKARGRGHIVNTSSILGLFPKANNAPYTAAKFAVVGFSEALRAEMAPHGVGVTILMPGLVRTAQNANSRPPQLVAGATTAAAVERPTGIEPDRVGDIVVEAVLKNRLYAITHPDYLPVVEDRMGRLIEAFRSSPAPVTGEDISFLGHDSLGLSERAA